MAPFAREASSRKPADDTIARPLAHASILMTKEDYYYAGVDLFSEGKLDEAIATYQKALALDPAYTDALHGLAQAYYTKDDFDNAIATARRIVELDPDDVLAYTSISRAYQRKGMIREAEEAGNKARVLGWKKQLQEQKAKGEGS